ncbi:MAG: GAF domain-containing protein [Pseudomonadota bacterium]
MTPTLTDLRDCFDSGLPATLVTTGVDGLPHVATLAHVQYVDAGHLAMPCQDGNPVRGTLTVHDPATSAQYRLALAADRREPFGPLFDNLHARLAALAAHAGTAADFALAGVDVFHVEQVEELAAPLLPAPPRPNLLGALRVASDRIRPVCELPQLLAEVLDCLERDFGIGHAMVLLLDESGGRLYTVASRGYEESGVGSEIAMGNGVIGMAAQACTPIRIGHLDSACAQGQALEAAIPLPGLMDARSQLAVPISGAMRLLGVLYVESRAPRQFGHDHEDALVTLCAQLGTAMQALQLMAEQPGEPEVAAAAAPAPAGEPAVVRYFPADGSLFIDEAYLIKGVAGAILAVLVQDFIEHGRSESTNRALRLDPRVGLPGVSDNLEARLLLLTRRLQEREACLRIERTGRGRFRLLVQRPLLFQTR